MARQKDLLRCFIFLLISQHNIVQAYKAVTVVPVADLLGEPLQSINKHNGTKHTKHSLALCGNPPGTHACPRIHQLLFNEIIEIVDQKGDEVAVKIPNLFFIDKMGRKVITYWSAKSNFIPLAVLESNDISTQAFPEPICVEKAPKVSENIITLVQPYYDPVTEQTYSAGTRFVSAQEPSETHYTVFIYHPKKTQIETVIIPKEKCLEIKNHNSPDELRRQFIKLLRSWAHVPNGFIPYVWGGCSYVHLAKNTTYKSEKLKHGKKQLGEVWELNDFTHAPRPGFDCAGLIARAAQMCNIPYFCKNSTTVAQTLEELQPHEQVRIGDIIWIPKHVMVVSDVKKHKIIEARIYSHGYGKVHEIHLSQAFKGIHTFSDLARACREKKPLDRLHADGSVVQTIDSCKLLKLPVAR